MAKFKEQFRVETSRLQSWDYSNPWWYFVTINTKNHEEFFGKIVDSKMQLNSLGSITEKYWCEIPVHFKCAEIDSFTIMPNHVHGIVILNGENKTVLIEREIVKTPDRASLRTPSLGEIINQLKGSVTRWAMKNDYTDFKWQSRFYDRIIRNEKELQQIRKYIFENPLKWELERNTPTNLEL